MPHTTPTIRENWTYPSKNELARSCKNLACKTCLARARDMSLFLHDSCTILHTSCKKWCKILQEMLQEKLPASLHIFCKILQELVQDCARIMQEKGHITCTCQASLACKILAQSCMILQVCFCWDERNHQNSLCQTFCPLNGGTSELNQQVCCYS